MFWTNFNFHQMKKKELIIPIAVLAIILGVFYRQYRAQQRVYEQETMMEADAIYVSYGGERIALEDPQGFMARYMLPMDMTAELKGAKFASGASFTLSFEQADGQVLGIFEFFPVKGKFDDTLPRMVWNDTVYMAKWGGYYYSFAVVDNLVMEELLPYLKKLEVPEP